MLAPTVILTLLCNALVVAVLSLAWHEVTRPSKLLGWFAGMLNMAHEYLKFRGDLSGDETNWRQVIKVACIAAVSGFYSWATHSLRECFACLAGQLALLWWFILNGIPTDRTSACAALAMVCASLLTTYPLNRFFNAR